MSVLVKHTKMIIVGIAAVVFVILQCFIFTALRDFYTDGGIVVIQITVCAEIATAILLILIGLCEEQLDGTGLTFKTPFGTKHYAWADVESYGIEVIQTKKGSLPRIRVSFREEKRRSVIEYRDDTVACMRHYRGLPAYDQWEEVKPLR